MPRRTYLPQWRGADRRVVTAGRLA